MRLGSVFGIPIIINFFFILLLFTATWIGNLLEIAILFIIVLWHELAHVIVAKYYQLNVLEIELLPFGGVAKIVELIQLEPKIERHVALAGPLSNGFLLFLIWLFPLDLYLPSSLLDFVVQANLGMMLFNLLPVLPLDGGRFLRSFLIEKYGYRQATDKAATLGQIAGVILFILGLFGALTYNWNALIFVVMGFFLLITAYQEKATSMYILVRYLTRKKQEIRLKRVLLAKELVATEEVTLGEILRQLTPSCYHIIWVLNIHGSLLGIVTELEMIDAFLEKGIQTQLGELIKCHL